MPLTPTIAIHLLVPLTLGGLVWGQWLGLV